MHINISGFFHIGGHAKTLMFVQLNPDANSFSESLSTLKFAERVSGVELGPARSSKDGKDVRELMEQVCDLSCSLIVFHVDSKLFLEKIISYSTSYNVLIFIYRLYFSKTPLH